jgi:hypothetical protein
VLTFLQVVDLARVFPPELPILGVKGSFLYRLLRPEFVKEYPVPLSSDAFSSWGKIEPENNQEIARATEALVREVIPQFISSGELSLAKDADVKEKLHKRGINLRYCALILSKCTQPASKQVLAIQIIARSFRALLEGGMRQLKSRLDDSYKELVANYFTLLFGQTEEAKTFWEGDLNADMQKRFLYMKGARVCD